MPNKYENFLSNLKISLIRNHPFFGHIIQQLPVVFDNNFVPTMGVRKRSRNEVTIKLYVNTNYIDQIAKICNGDNRRIAGHFQEILKHEILHIIFAHLTFDFPDKHRQEIACELADNSYVNRDNMISETEGVKPGVFPEDFKLESRLGTAEYYRLLNDNKKYREMASNSSFFGKSKEQKELEEIANEEDSESMKNGAFGNDSSNDLQDRKDSQNDLSKKTEEISKSLEDQFSKDTTDEDIKSNKEISKSLDEAKKHQKNAENALSSGDMQKASEEQKKASESLRKAANAMRKKQLKNIKFEMTDSHENWKAMEGDEITSEMIKDIVRQSNELCKKDGRWGDMPGELQDLIEDCYKTKEPVVPWETVLKDFIASSSENVLGYTTKRISKRYGTRPGTKKDDILSVAIGIDTSGSVDDEMIKVFFNEIRWISKTGSKMTIFEWDTEVKREYDFSEYDGTVSGRGGTDPTDFLEKVSERKYDCVIIFTDLEFSKVEKRYNIPMLWVVDQGGYNYFGDDYAVDEGIIMKFNEDRDGFEVIRR